MPFIEEIEILNEYLLEAVLLLNEELKIYPLLQGKVEKIETETFKDTFYIFLNIK